MDLRSDYGLGYLAASHDETRGWAVAHGGERAGEGWDTWWREHGPPDSFDEPVAETVGVIAPCAQSTIDGLTAERDAAIKRAVAAEADAKSWKMDFELYVNAWRRSLGNDLFNKRHLIDALVKTTVHLQKNYETWKAVIDATAEREQLETLAASFGVDHKDFIHG